MEGVTPSLSKWEEGGSAAVNVMLCFQIVPLQKIICMLHSFLGLQQPQKHRLCRADPTGIAIESPLLLDVPPGKA